MKLYKYLPREYLDCVLNDGCFLFRSLSYFQDFEDAGIRGDRYEGIQKFSVPDGLEINNLTTNKSNKEDWIFKSRVDSENIFIFSTSTALDDSLAREFKADVCIEFINPGQIISRLRSAVASRKTIKPNKLFHENVTYYSEEEAPGINWALPEKIVNRKLECFDRQQEYRLSFSLANALEFGNTSQEIEMASQKLSPRSLPYPEKVLKIGNIKKWCVVHEFT